MRGFAAWFIFCAVLSLVALGLTVWAVVSLVNHVVA